MLGKSNMSNVLLSWKTDLIMSMFVRPCMIAFTKVAHSTCKRSEQESLLFLILPSTVNVIYF